MHIEDNGRSIIFEREEHTDLDFSKIPQGATKTRWVIGASRFQRCGFEGLKADFTFGAGTEMTTYLECRFDKSHIRALTPGVARFERCSFRQVQIDKFMAQYVEFIDCTFSGSLVECNFNGSLTSSDQVRYKRAVNRFERNDFTEASLSWVAFKGGIDLLNQKLPTEDGYLLLETCALNAALEKAKSWPPSKSSKQLVRRLELEIDHIRVWPGQKHILFSPHDWTGDFGRQTIESITHLLRELGAVSVPTQANST